MEMYTLVEDARKALVVRGQKEFGSDGYPTALGYLEATLAHVLTELTELNPQAVERFIKRLDNLTKEL
jgi:hypothetical protein